MKIDRDELIQAIREAQAAGYDADAYYDVRLVDGSPYAVLSEAADGKEIVVSAIESDADPEALADGVIAERAERAEMLGRL